MKLYDLSSKQIEEIEYTMQYHPIMKLDSVWKQFAKDMGFKYETISFVHNSSDCDPLENYMFWAEPENEDIKNE